MSGSDVQTKETILVLCHSVLHTAYRTLKPLDGHIFKLWTSSRFIANLIIEKQAESPEGSYFAVTSKPIFEDFAIKFYNDTPSANQKENVEILRNSMFIVDRSDINALSLDDGIFVICDMLYSRSNYEPLLISNIPKKVEKADAFYNNRKPPASRPYVIYDTIEAELYLRGKFSELCKQADERIDKQIVKK